MPLSICTGITKIGRKMSDTLRAKSCYLFHRSCDPWIYSTLRVTWLRISRIIAYLERSLRSEFTIICICCMKIGLVEFSHNSNFFPVSSDSTYVEFIVCQSWNNRLVTRCPPRPYCNKMHLHLHSSLLIMDFWGPAREVRYSLVSL